MRRFNLKILLFSMLMIFSYPSIAHAKKVKAHVHLIDFITVKAPQITLGKIASIETKDSQLEEKLTQLVIDDVPIVGLSRIISSYKVKSILSSEDIEDVQVHGVQSSVYTESRELPSESIKDIVENWVAKQVGKDVDVEIKFIKLPRKWHVPTAKDMEYRISSRGRRMAGLINLRIQSVVGEKVLSTGHVKVNLSLFKEAVVLIRPLNKSEEITLDKIEIKRVDVSQLRGRELGNVDGILAMVAKRTLGVGTVLSKSDLEYPLKIQAGSLNRIVVVNGNIRMNLSGAKALQSGRKGDIILFANPLNEKEKIHAQVIDSGLARMVLR